MKWWKGWQAVTNTKQIKLIEGPLYDGRRWIINSLADNDYYAFTMGNELFLNHRGDVAAFRLINRGKSLLELIDLDELRKQLNHLSGLKITRKLIAFLRKQKVFAETYLKALRDATLPKLEVSIENGDLAIRAKGPHWLTTLLETPVLATLTTMATAKQLQLAHISEEVNHAVFRQRLVGKLLVLSEHKNVRAAEFGSRRRESLQSQRDVIEFSKRYAPGQLIGTSNVMLAMEYSIPVIGTMAHQKHMSEAAKAIASGVAEPLKAAQDNVQRDWQRVYGNKLSTILTDTFTSRFFFANLTKEQAESWWAYRQDSGDPIEYGERLLWVFDRFGIDPMKHALLCSDSLNFDKAIAIAEHFEGRIPVVFGIGTFLTNDSIFPALNIVWKLETINGLPTVKLGDGEGKACGQPEVVARYEELCHRKETDEEFWSRYPAPADADLLTAAA